MKILSNSNTTQTLELFISNNESFLTESCILLHNITDADFSVIYFSLPNSKWHIISQTKGAFDYLSTFKKQASFNQSNLEQFAHVNSLTATYSPIRVFNLHIGYVSVFSKNNEAKEVLDKAIFGICKQIQCLLNTYVNSVQEQEKKQHSEQSTSDNIVFDKLKDAFIKTQEISQQGYFIADYNSGFWQSSSYLDEILEIDSLYKRDIQGWINFIHEDDKQAIVTEALEAIKNQSIFKRECRIITNKTKKHKWVFALGQIYISINKNIEIIGFVKDISDRKESEIALKLSENKFSTLFYKSAVPLILICATNHKFYDASDSFLEVTGYSRNEVIGKTTLELNLYQDISERDRVMKEFQKQNGAIKDLVCYCQNKFGQKLIVSLTSYVVDIEGSKYFLASILDISKRRKVEEALALEQNRLHLALEAAKAGWWDLDIINDQPYFSKKYWDMLGYEPAEIEDNPNIRSMIFLPEELESLKKTYENALEVGLSHYEVELNLRHKNGYTVPVLSRAYIYRDDKGKPISVSGLNLDITKIKSIEKQLLESQSRLQLIISGSNDGLWDLDIYNNTFFYSDSYIEMLGYKPTEIFVDAETWPQLLHPKSAKITLERFNGFLSNKSVHKFELEFYFQHKNKQAIPILGRGIIVRDAHGKAIRVAGTNVNLTKLKKIEHELTLEKNRYRNLSQLIEQSNFSIIVMQPNGTINWINKALETSGGYSLEEVRGKKIGEFYLGTKTNKEAFFDAFKKAQKGYDSTNELLLYHKNGTAFWSRVYVQSIKNDAGKVTYIYATAEYIGQEKAIQLELEKSENKYQLLVDGMQDVVFSANAFGEISFLNAAWEKIMGYSIEESIGKPLLNFLHKDDASKNDILLKQITNNAFHNHVIRFIDKQNTIKWMDVSANSVTNDTSESLGISGTISDVTEQKRNRHFYELLSKNVKDLICLHKIDGTYIYVSPSVKEITGYDAEELIGKTPYDFFYQEDISHINDSHRRIIEKGDNINIVYRFVRKNGTTTWLETTTKVFFDEYELEGRLVTSSKVIDSRKEAEKQILESLNKEKLLNELKTRFITTISHEFRTPLAILTSSVELLHMFIKQGKLDVDFFNTIRNIEGEIEQLTKLVNDVLILQKINSGNATLRLEKTSIVTLLKNAIKKCSKKQTDKRSAQLIILGDEKPVIIDKYYIDIAINNLLSNAFKYSIGKPSPIVTVSFSFEEVCIQIEDFGIGIPNTDKEQLFSSFYRAKNVKNIEGTGLGLNIVKNFVELHGGRILFSSVENVGTEFFLHLPLKPIK